MTSAKVGALEEGDTVVALEVAVNEAGIIRVRCESGFAFHLTPQGCLHL